MLDPARDLEQLADLVELAFGPELTLTGSNIVADIRRLARLGPLLYLTTPLSLDPVGLVWEERHAIVGNVTLTRDDSGPFGQWIISNVAVHPDYRGRGIARQLMVAARDWIERHQGHRLVLQVRQDNAPAQSLYADLGFRRYATMVELVRRSNQPGNRTTNQTPPLYPLRSRHWQAAYDLALAAQPQAIQRIRPARSSTFKRSVGQRAGERLQALLGKRDVYRFYVERGERFLATLEVELRHAARQYRIRITVHPEARGEIEGPLVDRALSILAHHPPRQVLSSVVSSHPEAREALHDRGFVTLRVLDQLVLDIRGR